MARLDAHSGTEVLDEDASPGIVQIFTDIKSTLRVPVVNLIFRTLARHPAFLEIAWRQVKPNMQTVYMENCADEIRLRAVEAMSNLGAPPRPHPQALDALRVFHYVNPKLLLVVAAIRSSTNGILPVLQTLPMDKKRQITLGVPTDAPSIELVDTDVEDERIQSIFEDIKATLGVSVVNTDYRALAAWPDYLGWAWQSLKPVTARPEYLQTQRALKRMAEEAILSLPFRVNLTPHTLRLCGISEEEIDDVRTTLDRFYGLLPGLIANIAFLTVGGEGQYGAARSPFPISVL